MPTIRVNSHLPVAFYEMEADAFEEMTAALVDKEPGVVGSDLYRTKRQPQYGIDVIARRKDDAVEVASCKCYRTISKGDLKTWSDHFLDNWEEHWKGKKVRRFILVVSADVHSAQRDAEVQTERRRFEAIGLVYEIWPPRRIQEKLRPHPGIVSQHVGREHIERICGVVSVPFAMSSGESAVPNGLSADAISEIKNAISATVGHRLDDLTGRLETGDVAQTAAALDGISIGPQWNMLEDGTKARVLRLRAATHLHLGNDTAALMLADRADALEPQTEPRLRAALTYRREGAAAALVVLGEPISQAGAHLRAALLLETGDVPTAVVVLERHPAVAADHAETLRLRAWVAFMQDDRTEAVRLSNQALATAPNMPVMMRTAALAHYASALSPAVGGDRIIRCEPIGLDLVREDEASRGRLIRALELFDAASRKESSIDERRASEVFALACLCNLRDRTAEAAERVEVMLARAPGWHEVVYWALSRGLPLDRDALREILQAKVVEGENNPDDVLLLAIIEMTDDRSSAAIKLLEESTAFKTTEAASIRDRWLARFRRRASSGGETTTDDADDWELDELFEEAEASDNWLRVERRLDAMVTGASRPDPLVLPLARELAAAGRWDAVNRHRNALLALETPEPIRIAVYAAQHADEYAAVIEMLADRRGAFAGGRLPSDLARLEAEALSGIGDHAASIRTAVTLANASTATVEDKLAAALAYVRTGDLHSALPFVEAARKSGDLHPRQAIHLAQAISSTDRVVASSLLQQVISGPMERTLAPSAIRLALHLGLDRQVGPLIAELMALSDQPGSGIQRLRVEDLPNMLGKQQEAATNASRKHISGEVPVHLAADASGANLAQIYSLNDRGSPRRSSYPIMMLNGVRSVDDATKPRLGDGPLHVDVTALLIADQLDLMNVLERLEGRIFLPPSLPDALREMEDGLRPNQPSRLAATQETMGLVMSGLITTVETDDASSGQDHALHGDAVGYAWVLDFDRDLTVSESLARSDGTTQVNLRGIIDALLKEGAIDLERHRTAIVDLGTAGTGPAVGAPGRNDTIFLAELIAVELAVIGVLSLSARIFRLNLGSDSLRFMKAQIERAEEAKVIADRVSILRQRIARNLTAGTFRTLFLSRSAGDQDQNNLGLTSRCLLEVLSVPGTEGGITWIDDRHVTGHGLIGANRVFDTTTMLEALLEAGRITLQERWSAMLRLREADVLFLRIPPAEVVHHLTAAPIVEGKLVENRPLCILRRYMAKASEAASNLHIPPLWSRTSPGELPFLMSMRRLAEEVLLEIWLAEEGSLVERELRSRWVWSALRVDRLPDIGLPGTSPEAWRGLQTIGYASILLNGLQLLLRVKGGASRERLRAYMGWVGTVAVQAWVSTDNGFANEVATVFGRMLRNLFSDGNGELGENERLALQAILGSLIMEVPEPFRDHLLADRTLCLAAGIIRNEVLEFGGLQFPPALFWKAFGDALTSHEQTKVRTTDGRETLYLKVRAEERNGLAFLGALEGNLDDITLGLLSPDGDIRTKAARDVVKELGMGPGDAAAAVLQILKAGGPSERMEMAFRVRKTSVTARLADLCQRLEGGQSIAWSDFDPPDPRLLLRHAGIQPGAGMPVHKTLAKTARALLWDHGASEAVRRLVSLPAPLPAEVLEAVRELPKTERDELIAELGGEAATPLRRFHCLRILRDGEEAGLDTEEACKEACRIFSATWDAHARLFCLLLRRSGEGLYPDGNVSAGLGADEAIAASWIHADLLTGVFLQSGVDPEAMARLFLEGPNRRDGARAVVFRMDYDGAAAAPTSMTAEELLFYGAGYALGIEQPRYEAMQFAELRGWLKDALSVGADRTPIPWILADRDGAQDDLGSWFRTRSAWLLPERSDATIEAARAAVSSGLSALNDLWSDRPRLWLAMSIVARPFLDGERRVLAAKAVSGVDLTVLVESDSEIGPRLPRFVAELARASGDPAARVSFEDELIRYARRLSDARSGRFSANDDETVSHLVEAAAFSSGADDEAAGWRNFGRLIVRLATAWPGTTPRLRECVEALVRVTHPARSVSLWQSWLELRAMT